MRREKISRRKMKGNRERERGGVWGGIWRFWRLERQRSSLRIESNYSFLRYLDFVSARRRLIREGFKAASGPHGSTSSESPAACSSSTAWSSSRCSVALFSVPLLANEKHRVKHSTKKHRMLQASKAKATGLARLAVV